MNEIIRVKNNSYARYEELLLRRDSIRKEAFVWQRNYVAEFGDLIVAVFEKKVECIRKKKTIQFSLVAINHGNTVEHKQLQEYLQK